MPGQHSWQPNQKSPLHKLALQHPSLGLRCCRLWATGKKEWAWTRESWTREWHLSKILTIVSPGSGVSGKELSSPRQNSACDPGQVTSPLWASGCSTPKGRGGPWGLTKVFSSHTNRDWNFRWLNSATVLCHLKYRFTGKNKLSPWLWVLLLVTAYDEWVCCNPKSAWSDFRAQSFRFLAPDYTAVSAQDDIM